MKLLKPQKTQATAIAEQNNSLIRKGVEIAQLVDQNERKLNDFKANLEQKKKGYQTEFDIFFSDLSLAKETLLTSLANIELQKNEIKKDFKDSHTKILFDKKELEQNREENKKELKDLLISLDGKIEVLQILILELEKLEKSIKISSLKLKEENDDLKLNSEKVKSQAKENEKIVNFISGFLKDWEENLKKREKETEEIKIVQRALWNSIEEEKNRIEKDRIKLRDQQQTLKADYLAFKSLKK